MVKSGDRPLILEKVPVKVQEYEASGSSVVASGPLSVREPPRTRFPVTARRSEEVGWWPICSPPLRVNVPVLIDNVPRSLKPGEIAAPTLTVTLPLLAIVPRP